MGNLQQIGFSTAPMPAVARILSRYDRQKVEALIEVAIGLLDSFGAADDPDEPNFSPRSDGQPGDPSDIEEDDPCGQVDEEGINTLMGQLHLAIGLDGPGCPISDPCGPEMGSLV